MYKPVALITGGSSRTGQAVAKQLLATCNYRLRLGSRDPSKLSSFVAQQPNHADVEAVELNSTLESMQSALKGAETVFFVYPPLVGAAGDTLMSNFFQALNGSDSDVKHVVYLSSMRASGRDKGFELAYKHYENEQQMMRSGVPFTILRPTYFHENIVGYFAESIRRSGEYVTSAGDGVWTTVAISDVAAVAVAAIENPSEHAGKTYDLREEAVTHPQVAEKISKVIGKRVKAVSLTPEEHFQLLMKSSSSSSAHHAVRADKEKRDGEYCEVTPDLEMVLDRKGVTLDQFLAEHADEFRER